MTIGVWIRSGAARIVGAAIAGVLIGGGIGLLGVGESSPDAAFLALDAVPIYACPGTGEVGTLHRGDRVLITGRSGDWLAVRNVRGSAERVFVAAAVVTPDADLSGLPEEDCHDAGLVSVASTTTTLPEDTATTVPATTTTLPGTTTTIPGTTTTTIAPTTTIAATTTTTVAATTTTTTAPDNTAPSITGVSASEPQIWEQDGGGIFCVAGTPRQSTISATVTDAGSGIASVTASWNDPNGSHTVAMTKNGNVYSVVIGPYPANTWDPPPSDPGNSHNLAISIFAEDNEGNESQSGTSITVWEIGSCFI
jgi:hypothetical protein